MSSSPFRATVDMTGEQCVALDRLARTKSRSRNALIREAIDAYLRLQFPPAEAAREPVTVETAPPSAPVVGSRVASARRSHKGATTRWCSTPTHSIRGRE